MKRIYYVLFDYVIYLISTNAIQHELSKIAIVGTNGGVKLTCSFGKVAHKMRWYYTKKLPKDEDFVFDLKLKPKDGYLTDCDLAEQYCNLYIINATKEIAGFYRFEHGLYGEYGETACSYQVIAGDLGCDSNIRNNKLLIGQSDCSIEAETIKRSCSFEYHGNFDGPLNFVWMKRKNSIVTRDKVLNATSVEYRGDMSVLKVEDEIEVTNDMDETTFECYLEGRLDIQPCELSEIHVQYVKNTTSPTTISDDHDNISCSVIKSESVQCFHHWLIQSKQNIKLEVHSPVLTKDHLVVDGCYTCLSECHFVTGIIRQFQGTYFEWKQTEDNRFVIAVSCAAVVLFLVICAFVGVALRWKPFRNLWSPKTKEEDKLSNHLVTQRKPVQKFKSENGKACCETRYKVKNFGIG